MLHTVLVIKINGRVTNKSWIVKKTLSENRRSTESNKEHKYILEAIKSGDPKRAEEEANKHVISAYENMVKNGLYEAYGTEE